MNTDARQKKNKVEISFESILDSTPSVNYKYQYVQRSSNLITPGYEQFYRTTIPEFTSSQTNIEYRLTIKSGLDHPINTKDFTPVITINGKAVDAKIEGLSTIIPAIPKTVIINGPLFSSLKPRDKIVFTLYDVVTETRPDGTAASKDKFSWSMVYDASKESKRLVNDALVSGSLPQHTATV